MLTKVGRDFGLVDQGVKVSSNLVDKDEVPGKTLEWGVK